MQVNPYNFPVVHQNIPKQQKKPSNSIYPIRLNPMVISTYRPAFKGTYTPNEQAFIKFRNVLMDFYFDLQQKGYEAQFAYYRDMSNSKAKQEYYGYMGALNFYIINSGDNVSAALKEFETGGINDKDLKRHHNHIAKIFKPTSFKPGKEEEIINGEGGLNQLILNGKKDSDEYIEKYIELIKARNEFARTQTYEEKGRKFKNYYEYKFKSEYDVDLDNHFKKLDKLKERVEPIYFQLLENPDFDNYYYGTLIKPIIFKTGKSPEEISKTLFKKLGWDIDDYVNKGNLELDLYPNPNKLPNTWNISPIDSPNNVKVFANAKDNDIESLRLLNHEFGHAVYELSLPKTLHKLDRGYSSTSLTEGIAKLFEDIYLKEPELLKEELELTNEDIEQIKDFYPIYAVSHLYASIDQIYKEKNIYEIPDNELKKSNEELKHIIQESSTQYIENPGYHNIYLAADMISSQLYDSIKEKAGERPISEVIKPLLAENIFKYGKTKTEKEILKDFTGSELSEKSLLKIVEQVEASLKKEE
ncbi:MAG: hypothetical protein A2Y25_03930 [Candidatus Melainabacteria bacterium GWF2_37_15]|nr:MAG: hypothetical protein A2Y25_03930 [Candidatus Melainabacteria bacterium GWF2_37_15]